METKKQTKEEKVIADILNNHKYVWVELRDSGTIDGIKVTQDLNTKEFFILTKRNTVVIVPESNVSSIELYQDEEQFHDSASDDDEVTVE